MDRELARLVDIDTPKLNPLLANGLATEHLKNAENYVDQIFRSVARELPDGLVYKGYVRCTPREEYNEISKKRGGKRFYDVARSDVYLVKYLFEYKGEKLPPRYMFLPFVSTGGTIFIGGSRFVISPVLTDRVISIGISSIFVRLTRDRLTFERANHQCYIDGVRETTQVVWSQVYHLNSAKMRKIKKTTNAECSLVHYLFCKYGLSETFRMFGNTVPVVGGIEINEDSYPKDEWVICHSTGVKPKTFGVRGAFYDQSQLRIAIRRKEFTPFVKSLVGGLFYVADHFPTRVRPEYVDHTRLWKVLMGHVIWSGAISEGRLEVDVDSHLSSLDEYVDSLVAADLKDIGVPCTDLYHLFAIIVENFSDWLLGAADKINSMYDKQLNVLYYVMYDVTSAIIRMVFRWKPSNKTAKELTAKEIVTTMNNTLKTGLIFGISKGHGEVSTISSSGDNLAFKITANLVPQTNSNRLGSKKAKMVLSDPSKRLHVSVAEVGGYSNLPKAAPDGRSRINHHVRTDARGVVLRNPERKELLDEIQQLIQRP